LFTFFKNSKPQIIIALIGYINFIIFLVDYLALSHIRVFVCYCLLFFFNNFLVCFDFSIRGASRRLLLLSICNCFAFYRYFSNS